MLLPSRLRVDVGAGARYGHARLDLRIDNVTGRADQDLLGFPLPQRAWMLNLTWDAAPEDR